MIKCIAVVNTSTSSPLSTSITPTWLEGYAGALMAYLNDFVAAEHGGSARVRLSDGSDIAVAEQVLELTDSGDPQALGWHDEEDNGVQFGAVDVSLEATLDDLSMSGAHEAGEMFVNGAVNRWRDNGAGSEWAEEISDTVESNWWTLNGYRMSDFVTQSFFDPKGVAPFSFLDGLLLAGSDLSTATIVGVPGGPLQIASGGYQNGRSATSPVVQVFSDRAGLPPSGKRGRRAWDRKHAPWSRPARLGVRRANG